MPEKSSRRSAIRKFVTGSAALVAGSNLLSSYSTQNKSERKLELKGNINHSVCQWTYNFIPLEELCKVVKDTGFNAIDLIAPKDWPLLQKYGIYSSMCYHGGELILSDGWNSKNFHDLLIQEYTEVIPLMVKAGYKDV